VVRRRNPYPGLLAVALLPALALGGFWRLAEGRVPPPLVVDPPATAPVPVPVPGVGTPLLSVRRAPGVLARELSAATFSDEVARFAATLDDTSCVAVSVDGLPIGATRADQSLRPASNVKLLTAAVALDRLGADYTFTTELRGTLSAGVIAGDLYLVGGGDPLLSSEWWHGPNPKYPPFNVTPIEGLVSALRAAGVTSVQGSVIGDSSRYDDEWYAPSWTNDVRFTEGGPISALLVNDSREANDRSSADPVVGAAAVVTEALRSAGVAVGGTPGRGVAPAAVPVVASINSQPLSSVVAEMLTTSDNNTAEMLLKELGHHDGGAGSRDAGLAVVLSTLQSWGVATESVVLADGSGLSDDNRLTCNVLLAVLQHQRSDDALGLGLAVAGSKGGTLSDAFAGTALEGVLRGKTGTLYNYNDGIGGKPGAKALSGFVPVAGGGAIEFALVLNGPQVSEKVVYRPTWDGFAKALVSYPSGPSAASLGPR